MKNRYSYLKITVILAQLDTGPNSYLSPEVFSMVLGEFLMTSK